MKHKMGREETKIIRVVGNYSKFQASAEDCIICHNARMGTVIIDDVCLDCRDNIIKGEAMNKLLPEGEK